MIYKIVQGNGFTLHINISKVGLQADKQYLADLDLSQVKGLSAWLTDMFGGSIKLDSCISTNKANEILVAIPSNLDCGIYGIKLFGIYNGMDFGSIERRLFSIVESNREGHIPLGVIDGETGGLVYLKYWIELDDAENFPLSYYGALSTKNLANVNVGLLNSVSGIMENRTFAIQTTYTNNIIWFVSPKPLLFMQSGLPIELTMTQKNGMYYYNTDELTEGDNVITVNAM